MAPAHCAEKKKPPSRSEVQELGDPSKLLNTAHAAGSLQLKPLVLQIFPEPLKRLQLGNRLH